MPIRNLNWYNLQATRRYPLDDRATGETDRGDSLPNQIIVDCHLRFDRKYGAVAYIQAVTVTANIVTVLIGASADINSAGNTIASVTIPQPANINTNYALTGLAPGIGGWIVFGSGITDASFFGRFSLPSQSLLMPRSARAFRPLPITSIGKVGVRAGLTDVVALTAESPFLLTYDRPTNTVTFSLDYKDASVTYNPLSYFLGPCGQRPESGTCAKTPIETINGISPDCAGNINIVVENMSATMFSDCGGMEISTTYGLQQACQGAPPLPVFYSDLCCPQRFDTEAALETALTDTPDNFSVGDIVRIGTAPETAANPYVYKIVDSKTDDGVVWRPLTTDDEELKVALSKCDWPDPTELIPDVVITLPSLQDYPGLPTPLCVDFCSVEETPPLFDAIAGVFRGAAVPAPYGCMACGSDVAPPKTYEEKIALVTRNVYAAIDTNTTALSMFKNAATDWAIGKTISAQIKIGSAGVSRNGGLVINYRKTTENGILHTKYFAAVLDVARSQLRLLDYTNSNYIAVAATQIPLKTNQWYQLSVTITAKNDRVYLSINAEELRVDGITATIADYSVPLSAYEPQTGAFGLYAERSYTYFNAFGVS
jgi:hypothetical protein